MNFGEDMKAKKQIQKHTSPAPSVQNWEKFRQGANARIWYAALLSMDVEPKVKSRVQLKDLAPERYRMYLDRVDILTRLHGTHELFPDLKHIRSGVEPKNKYVSLKAVAEYAKANDWEGSEEFANRLVQPFVLALDGTKVHLSSETELDKLDQLPKGVRYNTIRMGALLAVLERILVTEPHSVSKLVRGNELNIAELARQIAATVATAAKRQKQSLPYGFRVDAASVQLLQARQAFEKLF